MSDPATKEVDADQIEHSTSHDADGKDKAVPAADQIKQQHADLYYEALEKYGHDGSIDPIPEKRLKRSDRVFHEWKAAVLILGRSGNWIGASCLT